MTPDMRLRPVGTVRNQQNEVIWGHGSSPQTWRERAVIDKRRQNEVSEIEISSDLEGVLDGIEDFSHLLILYWAHLSPVKSCSVLRGHPMGREDFPLVGIFATRSPIRPNSILATVVRLVERKGNILKVMGLDALNGSPVIDIKPYIPSDSPSGEVKMAAWLQQIHSEFSEINIDKTAD